MVRGVSLDHDHDHERVAEGEGEVHWAVTRKPLLRRAFAVDLPPWVVAGTLAPACSAPATN